MSLHHTISGALSPVLIDRLSYTSIRGRERYAITIGRWRISVEDSHNTTTTCLYCDDVRRLAWHCRSDDTATIARHIAAAVRRACPVIEVASNG